MAPQMYPTKRTPPCSSLKPIDNPYNKMNTWNTPGLRVPMACNICDTERVQHYNGPHQISAMQKMVGKQNPKTLIQPVIVPKITDLDYWKVNNLVTHSAINEESQFDEFASGYKVTSSCCPSNIKNPIDYAIPIGDDNIPNYPTNYPNEEEYITENFTNPSQNQPTVYPNGPGLVNTACGYNPKQLLSSGIPANIPVGHCQQNPAYKELNENLFTSIVTPGVYTTTQVNEPVNANMGISFNQQFEPITSRTDSETGEIFYTQHDPRLMEPKMPELNMNVINNVTEASVYDPRHSGYSTAYRAYTDENVGQTRFFYDDINSVRMPNYITRSNIDHMPFADSYGPLKEGYENGNPNTSDIHALANESYLNSALQHRNDITERAMRKINAQSWQQRAYPIQKHSQVSMGGRIGGGKF